MDKHRNQLLFQFGNVCLTSLQCSLMDSNMLGGLSTIDTPIVLTDPKPKTECSCLDMLNYGAKKCFFTVKKYVFILLWNVRFFSNKIFISTALFLTSSGNSKCRKSQSVKSIKILYILFKLYFFHSDDVTYEMMLIEKSCKNYAAFCFLFLTGQSYGYVNHDKAAQHIGVHEGALATGKDYVTKLKKKLATLLIHHNI